ncbi:MAG: 30S ribosomal protein S6 [Chloroflexi bacterium]|nr:30S ribosomal protein S6 [Chloroflexota bacterium]
MLTEYEMVTLFHPRLDDEGVEQLTQWVQDRIASLGGEVLEVIPWGRRSLAYPIKKHLEATYVQFDFKLDGNQMTELNRAMRLNEDILRQLPVRKADR